MLPTSQTGKIAARVRRAGVDLIAMLANDMTPEEIGDSLGVNHSTIRSRLFRLRENCDCKTNHGLVAWATRNGVI